MNDRFVFRGGTKEEGRGQIPMDVLPPGDYQFRVLRILKEPYEKKETGNWVMLVVLEILPTGHEVLYNAVTGGKWDRIGDLFLAVNRAPKVGEEFEYGRLIGARGRCRLKTGQYNGQDRNEVDRIYVPQQLQSATASEPAPVAKMRADLEREPDDIPF